VKASPSDPLMNITIFMQVNILNVFRILKLEVSEKLP